MKDIIGRVKDVTIILTILLCATVHVTVTLILIKKMLEIGAS